MSIRSYQALLWVAVVGAALAILLFPLGIFAHPHDDDNNPDDMRHVHYDENGMDMVRDFDSTDPERSRIEWNVRGVDAADFDIDSSTGVLTFIESPDFENATDRARVAVDLNNDGDTDDPGEAAFDADDNDYQITVSATEMSAALPAKRTDRTFTVTVVNKDDDGEVTLQWLQPEVGVGIEATLADPDGATSSPTWTWYRSKASDPVVGDLFDWTEITDELNATYTPAEADEGKYLWVHVEYTDPEGADKSADADSENPVRAAVSSGANASPDFYDDTDTRSVDEDTAVGDPVGLAVTATDTDNDTLTYELDDDADSTNELDDDSDLQFFDIDMATGQIEVAQELDYDAVGEDRAADAVAGTYTVIVRATDPSGLADNITVTITAENVNEDPIVTGRAELSVAEGITGAYTALPDAPAIDQGPEPTSQVNEYVYEDPDHLDSIARWHLEGDDAAAFDHSGRFEPRYLQFKVAPDFENPTDANNDNVYEVTLVATDTDPLGDGAGIGKVNVWLIVTNVEEAGKVVFTEGETAYLNETLVAEVQDPDDKGGDLGEPYEGVHIVTWQWSRSLDENDENDTPVGLPYDDIPGATTNRYTATETDRGYFLRATATYTDPHSAADDEDTDTIDERIAEGSLKTVMETTEFVVKVAPGPESEPTFDETAPVTREVAERTPAIATGELVGPGDPVGAPVAAMGPGTLVYSLEGSDAQYFNIDDMGQITVGGDDADTEDVTEAGTDPELDYDDPMKRQRFSVTVKVEVMGGDANQKAEVDVIIRVTDVDELPVITDEDVEKPPMTAPMYAEIDEDGAPNTAAIATYVGTDPEGDTISWDLRGADAALFTIPGGVLKFRTAPDYENPKDVVGTDTATPDATATNNEYDIVIRAIASRNSGETGPAEAVDTTVTVTVTDVDEPGEVVISWLQPEVNIAITASLTDADGSSGANVPVDDTETVISPTSWVWTVSEVVQGSLDVDNDQHWGNAPGGGSNSDSYTPAASDEGKYLRITASYTDRNGTDKTERAMSANPVQAAGLGATNQSPDFDGDKVELSVVETAAVGANVDAPVVATLRAPSSTDILTYGLRAFAAGDIGDTGLTFSDVASPAADLAAFDIDKATGQITVAQKLDFESRGTPDDGKYVVVATVTDPSNLGDSIVVVITAEDRNEDPVLSGRPELTINEIDGGNANANNPDFDGNPTDAVNVYNVVDEDRRSATDEWRLEGADKDQFQLIGEVGRTLVFRNQPDYETPADADGDNVYKVTVVTFDGDGGRGEFDVCIAVMNIEEDGKVTLFGEDGVELVQPRAHGAITAVLTDPDGGVSGVTWQWARSQFDPPTSGDPTNIVDATSDTYTPSNTDTSYFLMVTAMYTDGAEDITAGPRTAVVTAMHAVLEVVDQKRPPVFPEETATEGIAMRMVAENAPSTTFVGDHLPEAMDPDDPQGVGLTYTLEDSDNDSKDTAFFELFVVDPTPDDTTNDDARATTQIRVKLHDMAHDLDHEAEGRNGMYEVVLKVTDGDLEDSVTVTIMVTDRNEAPSAPAEASDDAVTPPPDDNNAPEFAAATDTRRVVEGTAAGENIGAPVAATDADTDDTLAYTLGGDDAANFAIDGATGQLSTAIIIPDAATQATHEVTVTADDGNGGEASVDVTITVIGGVLGDTSGDGSISRAEIIAAYRAYVNDGLYIRAEIIGIYRQYVADNS